MTIIDFKTNVIKKKKRVNNEKDSTSTNRKIGEPLMGMAASQARYLGLTARKTNVEYEGQQINQARTALSNQSATLWNQMLSLSIPTVPKTTDYTTVQYSFSDGYNDYSISTVQSVDKEVDGVKYNAQVTYYYNQDTFKGVQAKNTNPQAQAITKQETKTIDVPKTGTTTEDSANDTFKWDSASGKLQIKDNTGNYVDSDYAKLDVDSDEYKAYAEAYAHANGGTAFTGDLYMYTVYDADGNAITKYTTDLYDDTTMKADTDTDVTNKYINPNGNYTEQETITQDVLDYYMIGNSKASLYDPKDAEQAAAFEQIQQDFKGEVDFDPATTWVYTKNGKMCFARQEDIQASIDSAKDPTHKDDRFQISSDIDYQKSLNQYYATTLSQRIEEKDYAILDDASGSGRYSSIKLSNMSETFEVKSEEVTDEKSYNDAMNQYNYDVTQYEKAMSDINAKTSVIQEQDRTLELRLKQLETEQKALTTEMDAVKGVLQKNVESTFGTFK